jgi:hypothetical protein
MEFSWSQTKEVDAYKYLGVYFQSDGLWNVTIDSNMLKSRNILGELIQASFGDHGLQVGHNARLFQCCAMPQLLYGAEISTMNMTLMKKVETHLHKAAQAVFCKKGNSNVIFEALQGNLDWLSICSKFDMAKLRLFDRINRCKDESLLIKVLKARKHELEIGGDVVRNITYYQQKGALPWIYKVMSVILPRYGLSNFASMAALKRLSKSRWAALIKKRIKSIDLSKLKASMILWGTAAGHFYSKINCTNKHSEFLRMAF